MKRKRQLLTYLVGLYLVAVLLKGCSLYMRGTHPVYRDVTVAQVGTPRSTVLSTLGLPEKSEQLEGKRSDTYRIYPDAPSEQTNKNITVAYWIADSATLGLWEVIGTPIELATTSKPVTYVITYSANDRVESVRGGAEGAEDRTS